MKTKTKEVIFPSYINKVFIRLCVGVLLCVYVYLRENVCSECMYLPMCALVEFGCLLCIYVCIQSNLSIKFQKEIQ